MRAFEYGAGGSTIFVASRVGELVSVEHDGTWVHQVRKVAGSLGLANATILHVEAPVVARPPGEAADPNAYTSTDVECRGRDFRAYAGAIDQHPDGAFHFILIDGRARPSCVKHALPKLAPGGIIMLDNAERQHYAYIRNTLDGLGWMRLDFAGAGPYNQYFWKTTAWIRPGDAGRSPAPARSR
jgi:predicted O-methyltransferase YrrM